MGFLIRIDSARIVPSNGHSVLSRVRDKVPSRGVTWDGTVSAFLISMTCSGGIALHTSSWSGLQCNPDT